MRFLGSLPVFAASMVLALLLAIAGVAAIVTPAGSTLFGIVLLLAAGGLSGAARTARAAYVHRRDMASSWQWAQGLGPRERQGRRRL